MRQKMRENVISERDLELKNFQNRQLQDEM